MPILRVEKAEFPEKHYITTEKGHKDDVKAFVELRLQEKGFDLGKDIIVTNYFNGDKLYSQEA